jgi:hypothetical protein
MTHIVVFKIKTLFQKYNFALVKLGTCVPTRRFKIFIKIFIISCHCSKVKSAQFEVTDNEVVQNKFLLHGHLMNEYRVCYNTIS